jgi:hypothetical protein
MAVEEISLSGRTVTTLKELGSSFGCGRVLAWEAAVSFVTYGCYVLASRNSMRRIVASLVLGVMALSFVAPMALGATRTATLVCCRRNGKHHCASETSGVVAGPTDPSFQANSSDCPYRLQIATPTGVARPQSPALSTLQPPSASFVAIADCLFFESRLTTCNSQRGPPAFSL